VTPRLRTFLFETLYKNRYLYRFASTVPFAGQWRTWQRLVLPRLRGLDVLELGCGLGDLLADMLQAGYRCHAVEQSPAMVAAARKTLKKRKLGQPSQVIQGSAQGLPFSSNAFDTVVSTFPTEYIYDPNTIAEVERVLRPGGRLIVIEGANLLPIGFIQPLLIILHLLIYGTRGPLHLLGQNGESKQATTTSEQLKNSTHQHGVHTVVIADARFGRHIPLEQCGLRRRSELVRSSRWEVAITIGEKVK
jgi:ubiquinone/menaquinone biosynthesis C-methylase UbiE